LLIGVLYRDVFEFNVVMKIKLKPLFLLKLVFIFCFHFLGKGGGGGLRLWQHFKQMELYILLTKSMVIFILFAKLRPPVKTA
jgi:hypothetical protein